MSQTYRELLAWDYRSRIRRPIQPGCQNLCRSEKHAKLNQLWKMRLVVPIIFCRQCEYYTFEQKRSCYCCGKQMGCAKTRNSKSRKLNNENKKRY